MAETKRRWMAAADHKQALNSLREAPQQKDYQPRPDDDIVDWDCWRVNVNSGDDDCDDNNDHNNNHNNDHNNDHTNDHNNEDTVPQFMNGIILPLPTPQ